MGERGPDRAYGAAAISKCLHGIHFPVTKQDILNKYGSCEIEFRKGETMRLKDVLEDVNEDNFNSPVEIEKALHNKM